MKYLPSVFFVNHLSCGTIGIEPGPHQGISVDTGLRLLSNQ